MNTIKTIAVIGANGHLAIPVVRELVNKGFQVRAVVRNPEKAQLVLPPNVKIVQAELTDVASLTQALYKTDAVYSNLSMEVSHMKLSFYTEREGVKNIIEAAKLNGIQQILKIGALGSYPYATHIQKNIPQNLIRIQGHHLIEQSGIPFTIFHPSSFMDNLLWLAKKNTCRWIGKPVEHYWVNSIDYARQVVAAIGNPNALNKHYAIQGPEKLTYTDLEKAFRESFHPSFKVVASPISVVNCIGLFNSHMKYLGQLFDYFENNPENFYAQESWKDLGKPEITVEEFGHRIKEEYVLA